MAGAPKFPKIKIQFAATLMKNATIEQISGSLTCPMLRSTMVVVSEKPRSQ